MKSIIALIVVVILAGGGVLLWRNHNNKSTTPSNSTGNSSTSMNMPNSTDNNSNSTSSASQTDKVSISNFAFSPAKITVKKGTTVTWTNQDSTQHTVTSDSGDELKSEPLSNGSTYSHVFNTVGTFSYHCSFHSSMTGSVEVTE